MASREMIKAAVDHVPTPFLDGLYQIVSAMQKMGDVPAAKGESWADFLEQTYGCFADVPIERGAQGAFENPA